jgi:hypothetical protein
MLSKNILKPKSVSNFLIVGTVRNCEKYLKKDVLRLKSAMGDFNSLQWLLIESDSEDKTLNVLKELTNEINQFKYISLGKLTLNMPLRGERLAFSRNRYVEEIKSKEEYKKIDYVIVSDFDGINTHINKSSIDSCWLYNNWDMCGANQLGPYYDMWTLRHKDWCPYDYKVEYRRLKKKDPKNKKILKFCLYSKIKILPQTSDLIEVDSAFGGFAIYTRKCFDIGSYVGLYPDGEEVCEHVHFNLQLKEKGAKLYINPKLINASHTNHTKLSFWKWLRRKIKKILLLSKT